MAPKLPASQIFKGHAYELKYRAYRFCLNKKQANLLLYFGVILSKLEKNYYIPEICKNSKITPLRMHQKRNSWIHFRDGPLEKLCGVGGGDFRAARIFFSLSNSLYEYILGHSMNIFLGLIGVQEFFFM